MNIYDNNRLTRWGQRRLHGAFEECVSANETCADERNPGGERDD